MTSSNNQSSPGRSDQPTGSGSPGFTQQESGASGGPAPASDELAGRRPGEEAGKGAGSVDPDALRPGEHGDARGGAGQRDNADQHKVQGSADNDADHESGDQSLGAAKRMD